MPVIEELIDEKKLQELMQFLNITSFEELKRHIEQIELFTKDKFLEQMGLNGKSYQDIFSDQELEKLCKNKQIWIDSIDEAIAQQTKKQNSAAVITQDGTFVMQICGEDQDKTIRSITQAYHDFTGQPIQSKYYKNKEDFLAAPENQNLAKDVKQAVCNAGFPLTVYTLSFESKQQRQNFQSEIQDLIKNGKLRYLGKAPTNSPQPNPTPVEQEPADRQADSSSSPRLRR